jgi:hypothetical protein
LQPSSIIDVVKTTSHIDDEIVTTQTTTNLSTTNTSNEQGLSVVVNEDLNILSADGSLNMLIEQSDSLIISTQQQQQNSTAPPTAGNQHQSAYVNAPMGLFPIPLSKTAKTSQISRIKSKFKFLGKLMAKAVMDSRMVSKFFFIIVTNEC